MASRGLVATSQYVGASLVGLLIVGAVVLVVGKAEEAHPPAVSFVADAMDPPDPIAAGADLDVLLVQWGTSSEFTGNGAPGLNLLVEAKGSVTDWVVEGWATQETPSQFRVCAHDTVHFSPYDWAFQAGGGNDVGHGTFVGMPSTVPQRQSPDGDQCLLRFDSDGIWSVRICVEGDGEVRGLYDDGDGRRRDDWDRCVEKNVQVP